MRLLPHVHDYDMEYRQPGSLDFTMRCACGDVAPTLRAALDRTADSRSAAGAAILAYAAVLSLLALVIFY